ncbi:MAG: HlyD family type I secretion periplasmic adaptor subunit [Alphaproteobacteria bacterium]|nr:MAG: HlyD family type I secretion periplasmic adaptor subunit [Alphaproteobacteria bacterium]
MSGNGQKAWSARVPVLVGIGGIFALVFGLGLWSVSTEIEGAVIAPGVLRVESFHQVVQHPEGGRVAEVRVRDGDRVEAGQLLVRLDDSVLRSERTILERQLHELQARAARLAAERDGAAEVRFDAALEAAAQNDPGLAELLAGQRRLFEARREALDQQLRQLDEKVRQLEAQIEGLRAQRAAVARQRELIADELANTEQLLEKGLTRLGQAMALRREAARLDGVIGDLDSRIALAAAQIAETRLERLRLQSARREEAISLLRDISAKISELEQKLLAIDTRLSRLEVRAPVGGVIYNLAVHGPGAVVRPAEPILSIVPGRSRLVIDARVDPVHVDEVAPGQPVWLRFSALDARITPEIEGHVRKVSPDAFRDEASGALYYRVEIVPEPDQLARLGDVRLIPGMPVEAFIRTRPHTPLAWMLKPLTEYFTRAMRQS